MYGNPNCTPLIRKKNVMKWLCHLDRMWRRQSGNDPSGVASKKFCKMLVSLDVATNAQLKQKVGILCCSFKSSQVFSVFQLFSTLGTFLTLWIQRSGWSWERSRTWSKINFSSWMSFSFLFLPSTDLMGPKVELRTGGWEELTLPLCNYVVPLVKLSHWTFCDILVKLNCACFEW